MARPRNASFAAGGTDDVKAFLRDLRDLRGQAGLKHGELARRAHFPEDTLKSAEHGPGLPTLPVLEAYVRGCGASPAEWEDRWRRLTTRAALELGLPTRDPSAAKRAGAAGAAPPAAPVPAPRAADQELASRVVAGLDGHAPAASLAQPQATPVNGYQPFAPHAPMTRQTPMTAEAPMTAQAPGLAQPPGSAQAPRPAQPSPAAGIGAAQPAAQPPAPERRPRLRRARIIFVLIVAVILAGVAVVWLARPAAGIAHHARGPAPPGAAVPAPTGLPAVGQPG